MSTVYSHLAHLFRKIPGDEKLAHLRGQAAIALAALDDKKSLPAKRLAKEWMRFHAHLTKVVDTPDELLKQHKGLNAFWGQTLSFIYDTALPAERFYLGYFYIAVAKQFVTEPDRDMRKTIASTLDLIISDASHAPKGLFAQTHLKSLQATRSALQKPNFIRTIKNWFPLFFKKRSLNNQKFDSLKEHIILLESERALCQFLNILDDPSVMFIPPRATLKQNVRHARILLRNEPTAKKVQNWVNDLRNMRADYATFVDNGNVASKPSFLLQPTGETELTEMTVIMDADELLCELTTLGRSDIHTPIENSALPDDEVEAIFRHEVQLFSKSREGKRAYQQAVENLGGYQGQRTSEEGIEEEGGQAGGAHVGRRPFPFGSGDVSTPPLEAPPSIASGMNN